MLYWMDEYDPHAAGIELRRLTVDAASAGTLTQGVLRPVIDMAEGAEAQTAMAVLRWAAENQCARMDPAASTDYVRWESADPSIATVNPDGTVIGVSKGTVEIYAITTSGQRAASKITVK